VEAAFVRSEVPYPEASLPFSANVLNVQARAFYARHGVTAITPAAEAPRPSGLGSLDLQGRVVMTTTLCLRHSLGACLREHPRALAAPLVLVGDGDRRFPLTFDCDRCVMEVWDGEAG